MVTTIVHVKVVETHHVTKTHQQTRYMTEIARLTETSKVILTAHATSTKLVERVDCQNTPQKEFELKTKEKELKHDKEKLRQEQTSFNNDKEKFEESRKIFNVETNGWWMKDKERLRKEKECDGPLDSYLQCGGDYYGKWNWNAGYKDLKSEEACRKGLVCRKLDKHFSLCVDAPKEL